MGFVQISLSVRKQIADNWVNYNFSGRHRFRFYVPLVVLFCFVMPTAVPVLMWGENVWTAFFVAAVFRYVFTLNVTWTVNSIAHFYGSRPYDKTINPRENYVVNLKSVMNPGISRHRVFLSAYNTEL